ncbi:MAG: hypothetical protein KAS16_07145 [Thermoplasmata archaeon]|nr:hypothetical protein [Thermoplasmata archaeon]
MAQFLIRYGEIGLKSKAVRQRFQRILVDNIQTQFMHNGLECRTTSDYGRVYLWTGDADAARPILARVFGIVSFSEVQETISKMEDIGTVAIELAKPLLSHGTRFAVRARRTGEHAFTSMELGRDVGSAIYLAHEDLELKVDLTKPEVEVHVEVRQNKTYLFVDRQPGPGGMPLSSQGKILGLVEEEKDIVSIWLMMKRGCRVYLMAKDETLVEPLRAWDPNLKLIDYPKNVDDDTISHMAWRKKAEGIVVGWTLEQMGEKSFDLDLPIFHPVVGLSDDEIGKMLEMVRRG